MNNGKPAALILGGSENALSLTRCLGRRGIDIFLSVYFDKNANFSSYITQKFPYKNKDAVHDFWTELLFSEKNSFLHGSVIFACNDDAVEYLAQHNDKLKKLYILDDSVPEMHLDMLDKKKTLELSQSLSIPTPQYLELNQNTDIGDILNIFEYPIMLKPINSHLFQKKVSGKKYFKAFNREELLGYIDQLQTLGLEAMVTELIPGPDTQLASYYTYIDSKGNSLFEYTKMVIRRFPKNEGRGCMHKSGWNEEVAELGSKFFNGLNYRGMGNIEFKLDVRDGKYKVIECNPRFTAAQELLVRCGLDAPSIIYNHLTGLPPYPYSLSKKDYYFWYPVRDYKAYKELKHKKELSFGGWLKSVAQFNVMPYFQWSDLNPTLKPFIQGIRNRLSS